MLYRSLILFLGITVGFVAAVVIFWGFRYRNVRDEDGEEVGFWRRGVVAKRKANKEKNLERLRQYIAGEETVTNNDVEALLGVSDATAERYLDELEKEGELEQVNTGRHAKYRPKS